VINNALSAPDGGAIDSTSFTIGLFDEDDALCPTPAVTACLGGVTYLDGCHCSIMADLNPAHVITHPLPPFDDVSVVEVVVNVGSSKAVHWDWLYNAYYQSPFGEFWAEVVDATGQTTTVTPKVSAPEPWGFTPTGTPAMGSFTSGSQHVDLDLSPWLGQRLVIRFVLHSSYVPEFFQLPNCSFPVCGGGWDAGASKAYVSNFRFDTCAVTSVEFESINSPIDDNPDYAGGGERIFPDAQVPKDTTDRSGVNVVVHGEPNCKINLLSLDVDDSTNDPTIDANGLDGNDNANGQGDCGIWAGGGCETSVTIGPDGTGRSQFRVTNVPGANFVIVADQDVEKLRAVTTSGTKVTAADGKDVPANARTPMLTVWRRLHIERDAMGPVVGNHASGKILSVKADPQCDPGAPIGIQVDTVLSSHPNLIDRFQFGRLVAGGQSIRVAGNLRQAICVSGNLAALRNLQGQPFVLYDDDDFNVNDGSMLHGDEGEPLRFPSTALLQDSDVQRDNVLAVAYIRPTYDIGGGTAPFALNVTDRNNLDPYFSAFDNVATTMDPDFWTLYLLGAYQGTEDASFDPDGGEAGRGISDRNGGTGSLIFLETITDVDGLVVGTEAEIVAHEIGHLLCGKHGDGLLMGEPAPPQNGGPPQPQGGIDGDTFSSKTLARVRAATRWNGGCP
jgi:hypothetical protein